MAKIHGYSGHRLYTVWRDIHNRCYNENNKDYKNYGARGIRVCEQWHSIENFINDMYPTFQEGLSIDRENVNGHYELDNCRWVCKNTQARNTRKIMKTNKSGFRGVSFFKRTQKYVIKLGLNNKVLHLGTVTIPEQGALIYDTYIRENNLEHTKNFSDEEYYKLLEKYKNG